ncbi:hypothetical protein COLO4_35024 [Corchorus olitorius]|uniref:Uncharacterized protein n=1 Tax=Corchorus olitorius TaxID=93759 RepID=A0A1R3GID8_9ROSI|nr:hypothetical protein COLO4_35024 [Corchorus olitorius]
MQTSSVEIEHVSDRADDSILETAAISLVPADDGPRTVGNICGAKARISSSARVVLKSHSKQPQPIVSFPSLFDSYRGKIHHSSLLLGSSSVAHALHYCTGLAHPTQT